MRSRRQKAKPVTLGKGLFNLTLLLFAFAFSASAQTVKNLAEQNLEEGRRLLAAGHITAAVAAFNRHKQTHPADARAYFHASLALVEAGRLSDAALEMDEARRLDSQRPEYIVLQANLLARLKHRERAEEALAMLQKQGGIERLEASWLWMLSDVYFRLERFSDTLRVLDLLEQRNPADPRLELNRGQAYAYQSRFDQALESFRKSLAQHPANPLTHFELGKLLYQRNDLPAAKKALLEAVRLEKNNPQYLQKLGALCLVLNEVDAALPHLERAAVLAPHSAQVAYSLGRAYQRKGQHEQAAAVMKHFQELKRREEAAEELDRLLARGERLLDEGKEAEAQATFEQITQTAPGNWTAHAYLAELFVLRADWQKAWPHLEKLEALEPDSVVGNYLLARHWYLRQEFARARVYAEKVKQSRPAHAELRNLLGQIYLGLGQRELSRREFEEAVRLAPGRADFRANLAQLKHQ